MTFLSLGILVFAFGASLLKGRPFGIKVLKVIFIIAIIAVFLYLFIILISNMSLGNRLSRQNSYCRLIRPLIISLNTSAPDFCALFDFFDSRDFIFIRGETVEQKYEERFFEPEELWFGALAIFLVGHPGWLFYFTSLILIYFLIHIFSFLISHFSSFRISLYYLWLPLAIFVILINKWLVELEVWKLLKI